MNASEKILVIKLGALGDFVYALGPMAAIRKYHKNAHITLLTTTPFLQLAKECNYFDDIWIDQKPKYNPFQWMAQKKKLNQADFVRVYDLQNNDRTASYFKLFEPKPEWVGAVKGASHRNASPERTKHHAFHGHAETLKNAGIVNVQIDPLEWMKGNPQKYKLSQPYVLLVPGSSAKHIHKRWPAISYRLLAEEMIAHGLHPVLLGGADEQNITREICAGLNCTDLSAQTSLFDIPALARGAKAAIGNDTGPMHMIAVTGCPSLVLFNKKLSNAQKHGPVGPRVKTIEVEDLKTLQPDYVWGEFKSFIPSP